MRLKISGALELYWLIGNVSLYHLRLHSVSKYPWLNYNAKKIYSESLSPFDIARWHSSGLGCLDKALSHIDLGPIALEEIKPKTFSLTFPLISLYRQTGSLFLMP